jgi:preprotein translocase subunit SecG
MKLFNTINNTLNKSMLTIILMFLFFILTISLMHNVYAGKPTISLNAPASFPVDI